MHAQKMARTMRKTLLWTSCNSCDHEGVSLSMCLAKALAPYKHDTRRDSHNLRICTRKTHHQQAATAVRQEQSQCRYSDNVYNYTSVYPCTYLYIYISTYLYICVRTYIYASQRGRPVRKDAADARYSYGAATALSQAKELQQPPRRERESRLLKKS